MDQQWVEEAQQGLMPPRTQMLVLYRPGVVFKLDIFLSWRSHAYSVTPVSVNVAGTRGRKPSRRVQLKGGMHEALLRDIRLRSIWVGKLV